MSSPSTADTPSQGNLALLMYFPLITARRIDRDMFAQRMKTLGYAMLNEKYDRRDDPDRIDEEVRSAIASASDAKSREHSGLDLKSTPDVALEAARERIISKRRLLRNLENLVDEQLASVLLIDRIFGAVRMASAIKDAVYVVHGLQKKGNIFYYHSELKLQNVKVEPRESDSAEHAGYDHLVVSEEMFFVGTRTDGLFIHVIVPSLDGRSGAYDWVQRWLSDFRVVL